MYKYLMFSALLLLAACGDKPEAHNHEGGHDHYHSHEGETRALGTREAGPYTVTAYLKDTVNRGGLTVFELLVEGKPATLADLSGEAIDSNGQRIAAIAGFHEMAQAGRFGAHLGLAADAPESFRIVFRVAGQTAEFEVKP